MMFIKKALFVLITIGAIMLTACDDSKDVAKDAVDTTKDAVEDAVDAQVSLKHRCDLLAKKMLHDLQTVVLQTQPDHV